MAYKYELHLHTCLGSACAVAHGQEYITHYKKLGYQGIFVTDHFYLGNSCVDRRLAWEDWVNAYCKGYEELKRLGDEQGLSVFFGWETTYDGDDFLYYGLNKEWLLAHGDIIHWDHKRCYEEVKKAGGFVIQAHPFRERDYIDTIHLHPHQCDAFEIANAGNMAYQDLSAYRYAKLHKIPMTCGSDIHSTKGHIADRPFALVTEEVIETEKDLGRIILSGKYSLNYPEERLSGTFKKPAIPVLLHDEENAGHAYDLSEIAY